MDTLLKVEKMTYTVPFGPNLLKDISFELKKGEFLGVLGQNGAGKTTLIELIMGFKPHSDGQMLVLGEEPHSLTRQHRDRVSFISHDVDLKGDMVIRDFLNFHALFFKSYDFSFEKQLINIFKIDETKEIGSLSTGQQKKIQIIAALASKPNIVVIDEITAVLDPHARKVLFKCLNQIKEKYGMSIILATNIAEDLESNADKILFINEKSSSVHGPSEINNLFAEEAA